MLTSVTQQTIHWQAANVAVKAAVEHAEKLEIKVNVAVVDVAGHLTAFLRMPGAYIHSIDIAKDKAFTASSFGFGTDQWESIFAEAPILKTGMPNREKLVVFGGGLPIKLDETIIGAIGVSGGSEKQDIECAEAGLGAIKNQ